MPTRRDFLYGSGAALVAAAGIAEIHTDVALSPASASEAIQGHEVMGLSATLTLADGSTLRFLAVSGLDLGDFKVPFAGILQRNVVVKSDDGRFSVYFRPDRDGKRKEVVVLYGDPFNNAPSTMASYTCEIFDGASSIAKVDVPQHFWLSRWRWQSAVRARVRSPADLVKANLSVAYAPTSITDRLPKPAKPYQIMGASNITLFMGQTGERGDIGQLPEYTAAYMATGDDAAYDSMMAWAEASASGPWHINDPRTHAILNWDNWGRSTTYTDQPQQSGAEMYLAPHPYPKADCIRPDAAHHPCLSYIPFLSTGDPFHAEELQYQINYYFGHENGSAVKKYIFDDQTRGWAWMLRSTAFAEIASNLIQSAVLLPKEFWSRVLSHNLAWITDNFVNGTSINARVFFSGTSKIHMGWWQEDYLCGVLATIVRLGHTDWRPVLDWKIQSNINRLNGTSGWPRTHPTIYYAQYFDSMVSAAASNVGNGSPGVIGYEVRSGVEYGTWSIEFTSPLTFKVYRPGHKFDASGTVGRRYSSGYGPAFTVSEGAAAFVSGDKFTVELTPIKTWEDLARVNGVTPAPDGHIEGAKGEGYLALVYAAMVLAAPLIPEVKRPLEWLVGEMREGGSRIPWRDSFAS